MTYLPKQITFTDRFIPSVYLVLPSSDILETASG